MPEVAKVKLLHSTPVRRAQPLLAGKYKFAGKEDRRDAPCVGSWESLLRGLMRELRVRFELQAFTP